MPPPYPLPPSHLLLFLSTTSLLFTAATTTLLTGPSMQPTYSNCGDIVLVDKLFWKMSGLKVGDIVIATPSPNKQVCKRVSKPPEPLPKGSLWLLGDNLSQSRDSRDYGTVDESKIVGRVVAKLWGW